jgi:hypothetical protein
LYFCDAPEAERISSAGFHEKFFVAPEMSALPPKADIDRDQSDVRLVPKADSCSAAKKIAITSSAWASSAGNITRLLPGANRPQWDANADPNDVEVSVVEMHSPRSRR